MAAGPPPWMQRARHDAPPPPPQQEYEEPEPEYQPSPVHPLHRYAAQQPAAHEQDHHAPAQQYADEQPVDPSRYDDALYGQLESGQHEYARDPAFPDDPYAYQSDYEEEPEPPRKRSNGLITVAAVLALAVVGTGAAFAYRTYVGSPRSGEPPIIKADNSPTKVMATPGDGAAGKTPDRMVPGDGGEKIVSREEAPVDVNSRSGPRVVFPPLNQNGSPPSVASVSPAAPPPPTAANGSLPNNEPRKVKTLAVKGDADNGGVPAGVAAPAKPAPAARTAAPAPAPAARAAQPVIRQRQRQWPARADAARRRSARSGAHPCRRNQSGAGRAFRRRIPRSGLLAEERGRCAGFLPGATGQVSIRAGDTLGFDQAGGSRRKGRRLPLDGRAVWLPGGGGAAVRQPENCRRTVRHPQELTAVSLTREL